MTQKYLEYFFSFLFYLHYLQTSSCHLFEAYKMIFCENNVFYILRWEIDMIVKEFNQ